MIVRRSIAPWGLAVAALPVVGLLVWQAVADSGNVPDPTALTGTLTTGAVVLDSGLLVFREGLEAILVLAAVTAGLSRTGGSLRGPVAAGAGVAFLASIATWFVAIGVIGALGGPGLEVQAVTGLLAVVVLLLVMNWFFHKVYWTGWIAHHNRRRRRILADSGEEPSPKTVLALALLGFTVVYREGFEIVLFLQNLRLKAGSWVVLEGVALGLALTLAVGAIMFASHRRLPYRKLLVATGILLGAVLLVMVGESAQELQLAGWLPATPIGVDFPGWLGLWFAVFPTVESLAAQALAALLVVGSFFAADYVRLRRPRRVHAEA